ncbi:MAG: hypothetical protein EOS61_31870, partial [Mesorhizobium sp.]
MASSVSSGGPQALAVEIAGDLGGDRLRVDAGAADEVGVPLAQEAEAERVEAGNAGDAALMRDLAIGAERNRL